MRVILSLLVCLIVVPLAWSQDASEEPKPEVFTGSIVDAGGAVSRATSTFFTLQINEYTSDEEVASLAGLLQSQGSEALGKALRKIDRGFIRVGSRLGYPVSVARSFEADGVRVVRVLTDRPVQMFEVRRGLRSADHTFGVIELRLDSSGRGEGRLIAAAQIELKDGMLEIESFGTEPFVLKAVRQRVEKSRKKKGQDR